MRLHRRHQHALWQVEVALVDRSVDDARPLDEIDHLVEHAAGIVPGCVVRFRERCQQRLDDFAAIPGAGPNAGATKIRDVVIDRAKLELGLQQTMAACQATTLHALYLGRQDGVAMQHDERANRSGEAQRPRAPAHVLWHLQALDQPIDERLRMRGERLGSDRNGCGQQAVSHLELLRGQPVLARESLRRLRPRTIVVAGCLLRRPRLNSGLCGRFAWHALGDHRDPPRCHEDLDRGRRQATLRQETFDRQTRLALGDATGVRGQFLTPKLDQQRSRHESSSPR